MSEQQQLHHASLFNAVPNNRPPGPPYMYMTQAGSRLDGVGLQQNMYYVPYRTPDQVSQYVMRQPAMFCAYPQPMADIPMATAAPDEYAPLGVAHQYPPQVAYQQIIPNNQSFLTNSTQNQRHSNVPASSAASNTLSRPKRPLLVLNPDTKTAVDLEADDDRKVSEIQPKPLIKIVESAVIPPPDPLITPSEVLKTDECESVPPPSCIPDRERTPTSDDHVEQRESETPVENGLSTAESCPDTEHDTGSDDESAVESTDEDAMKSLRRCYNRDFMLTLKNSPISRVPLQELEVCCCKFVIFYLRSYLNFTIYER